MVTPLRRKFAVDNPPFAGEKNACSRTGVQEIGNKKPEIATYFGQPENLWIDGALARLIFGLEREMRRKNGRGDEVARAPPGGARWTVPFRKGPSKAMLLTARRTYCLSRRVALSAGVLRALVAVAGSEIRLTERGASCRKRHYACEKRERNFAPHRHASF